MKHVVSVLEVQPGGNVVPLFEDYVKSSNIDKAKTAVKELLAKRGGRKVRTISFATNGKILAYVVKVAPAKRMRYIAESTLKPK